MKNITINWPNGTFTIRNVKESLVKEGIDFSIVSLHKRIKREIEEGKIVEDGQIKGDSGRPSILYKKA